MQPLNITVSLFQIPVKYSNAVIDAKVLFLSNLRVVKEIAKIKHAKIFLR